MTLPRDAEFDVAVVGGGIHGAGVARAAQQAGLRTLLIERHEWAAATSRSSSKLIHGGLRYLETGQINLVYHSLRERQRLFREEPALVKPTRFFIPIYRDSQRRPWQIRAGLSLYALLCGLRPQGWFRSVPRSQWQTLEGLRQHDLQAVFQYWDGQTDDCALTRAVATQAEQAGAQCLQRTEFLAAHFEQDAYVLDLQTHDENWQCRARHLVNAAGPWVNDVLLRCNPAPPQRAISWVKGSHIVVSAPSLPGIFYLEAADGRAVFVMPWQGRTLIGTTEQIVQKPETTPSQAEIDYLLATARHYFPRMALQVESSFAGVRVLPRSDEQPFSRPRDSVLTCQRTGHSALVSIYGGKLTTFRHTAAQALALLPPRS